MKTAPSATYDDVPDSFWTPTPNPPVRHETRTTITNAPLTRRGHINAHAAQVNQLVRTAVNYLLANPHPISSPRLARAIGLPNTSAKQLGCLLRDHPDVKRIDTTTRNRWVHKTHAEQAD